MFFIKKEDEDITSKKPRIFKDDEPTLTKHKLTFRNFNENQFIDWLIINRHPQNYIEDVMKILKRIKCDRSGAPFKLIKNIEHGILIQLESIQRNVPDDNIIVEEIVNTLLIPVFLCPSKDVDMPCYIFDKDRLQCRCIRILDFPAVLDELNRRGVECLHIPLPATKSSIQLYNTIGVQRFQPNTHPLDGIFFIQIYTSHNAKCIRCHSCNNILTVDDFIYHQHSKNRKYLTAEESRLLYCNNRLVFTDQDNINAIRVFNRLRSKYELELRNSTTIFKQSAATATTPTIYFDNCDKNWDDLRNKQKLYKPMYDMHKTDFLLLLYYSPFIVTPLTFLDYLIDIKMEQQKQTHTSILNALTVI